MIKSFRDLKVWQRSHQLFLSAYLEIDKMPQKENYRVKDQLIRCLLSIPTNIAEGSGRHTKK